MRGLPKEVVDRLDEKIAEAKVKLTKDPKDNLTSEERLAIAISCGVDFKIVEDGEDFVFSTEAVDIEWNGREFRVKTC